MVARISRCDGIHVLYSVHISRRNATCTCTRYCANMSNRSRFLLHSPAQKGLMFMLAKSPCSAAVSLRSHSRCSQRRTQHTPYCPPEANLIPSQRPSRMPSSKGRFPHVTNNRMLLSTIPCAVLLCLVFSEPEHLLSHLPHRRATTPSQADSSTHVPADDMDSHNKKYAWQQYGPGRSR